MSQQILIVEDEADIRELLRFNLEREGFSVLEAADGNEGLKLARQHMPDLMLLDVMLPGFDGFEVCRRLGAQSETANIPVLMLTARGEEMDRVVGLSLGADDYVVKPFSVRELMLRIRAVLRRGTRSSESPVLERHGIRLRPEAHTAEVQGEEMPLTATEFRLLEDLLRHAGAVRTREQLLNKVWGYSFEGYARTVDTHVRRLRAKLGGAAAMLETVRGVGYRIKE
ncbi:MULTISPECIES: response regulator [unclassified Desulfovibrio]|jgi:two-component system phosphate regulon response regulator PhoB|uniref:Phosphate regulon transcriptional regulatory protein PhoB n=1 Tax=uncultured Desulfovibrio sp. TaxID=167968 RepID=A0A212L8U5_9BACT|nr:MULTISPECIES: response regulator [unclassified Desulfovibrio]MDY0259372.1 response regulator [Desulfovibrio sp.]SCM73907.1 Phosphate regulon transcriptional regulatory protein PhoB [uncultured Desulfovibrio sp.]VZH34519.1 Phosphate regulon transcriptional regulatory protein PhoB [Desulfovibrio sp. 86]